MIEWRSLPGYPQYEVSEYGVVRRTVEDLNGTYPKGFVLRPTLNKSGYFYFDLTNDNNESMRVLAHRAVALAFHGDPPEGRMLALHKDDVKLHNHYSNLYWGTPKNNQDDAVRNGKVKHGANHPLANLTHEQIAEIRSDYVPGVFGYKRIARKYGISPDKAKDIVLKRTYK
jgi:hypothetical protein